MRLRHVVLGLVFLSGSTASSEQIVSYEAPSFLDGPVVANSLLGTTYAYRAHDVLAPLAMQITIVNLPKTAVAAGEFSNDHCIQLFLTEVARDRARFFALPVEKPLEAGAIELQQVRWTRKEAVDGMTGVTSCALHKNRYISINFQDSLNNAVTSFPAIRSSLKSLTLN